MYAVILFREDGTTVRDKRHFKTLAFATRFAYITAKLYGFVDFRIEPLAPVGVK